MDIIDSLINSSSLAKITTKQNKIDSSPKIIKFQTRKKKKYRLAWWMNSVSYYECVCTCNTCNMYSHTHTTIFHNTALNNLQYTIIQHIDNA